MKTYIIHFKSKAGDQHMELVARNEDEARLLAERAQFRRHERFPLTFARLEESLEKGDMDKAIHAAQVELRKRDQARYDDSDLKIQSIKEKS